MSKPDAPTPPDPFQVANAQYGFGQDTALFNANLNRLNQQTPYGSLQYSSQFDQQGYDDALSKYQDWEQMVRSSPTYSPQAHPLEWMRSRAKQVGNPYPTEADFTNYSVETQLAPEQQQLLDLQNQAGLAFGQTALDQLGNVQNTLSQPVDFSQFGPVPTPDDQMRQSMMESIISRQQPYWDRDRSRLETRLANQGIDIGSEAYGDAFNTFQRGINDARLGADIQSGQEMQRMFGLGLQGRQQGIQEMMMGRNQPLNELAALRGGAQVQNPQFVDVPQSGMQAPNYQQAAMNEYQGQLQNYGNELGTYNSMMGGLFGLGSAGLLAMGPFGAGAGAGLGAASSGGMGGSAAQGAMAGLTPFLSDRRMKRNIRLVGSLPNGLNVYMFHYKFGGPEQIGVMADEVKEIMPHAVHNFGGFDFVDYAEVLG